MKETLEKIAELKRQEKYIDGSISTWTKNDWQACYKEGFIEGAEYQATQMYSEKEVLTILKSHKEFIVKELKGLSSFKNEKEWFEQYRKK